MEAKNYFELERFSLRFKYFCFIDVSGYLADAIFVKHKVRVCFQDEYGKDGTEYLAILCKVKKKDRKKFIGVMKELEQKMLLLGHNDYFVFCEEIQKRMVNLRR